jgi:hypothetical protein
MEEVRKKKMPKWGVALIIIAVVLVYVIPMTIVVFGLSSEISEKLLVEDKTKYMWDSENLTMEKTSLVGYYDEEKESFVIEGLLKNNNEIREYKNVWIEFKLFDMDGNVLDTVEAYLYKFGANETWKINAAYESKFADHVASFDIINLYYSYY